MILVKLLPDQVARHWDTIKEAVRNSLPPIASEGPDKMNKVLEGLMSGFLTAWAGGEVEMPSPKIKVIGLTHFTIDHVTGTKNLLIYCLYAFRPVSDEEWVDLYEKLRLYAKGNECHRVVAYTEDSRILEICRNLKGDTRYTFVSLPI